MRISTLILNSSTNAGRVRERRIAAGLLISTACWYLLTGGGHIYTPDGVLMFQVTQALVDRQSASVPGLSIEPGSVTTQRVTRADGQVAVYSKYGLGLSLAAAPSYLIGRLLLPLIGGGQRDLFRIPPSEAARRESFARDGTVAGGRGDFRWLYYDPSASQASEGFLAFCVAWTNSFIVAGIVVGVFRTCRLLAHSNLVSLMTAISAALATPLWAYAKDFFAEPLAGLGLIWFLAFVLKGRAERRPSVWFWSGTALGLAPLAKPALIVLALPAALLVATELRHRPAGDRLRHSIAFSAGLGCVLAVVAAYNHVRFGSFLETGYGSEAGEFTTPFAFGVIGLLASPGRGLFVYFPLWLLLIPAFRLSAGNRRSVFVFAMLSLLTLIALYGSWHQWEGGVCWGPRFLIPAIPPLMVPLASVFEVWLSRRATRIALALLLAVSTAVAFSGTVVNYFEYANWLQWQVRTDPRFAAQGITSAYQLFVLRFAYAPVLANWTFFRWDYYFILDALRTPGAVLAIYAVFAAGLGIGLLQLLAAFRWTSDNHPLHPGPARRDA